MKRCLIQVFARLPEPGKVKTRLIPAMGAEGAAVFAAERLQTTLAAASQIEAADTEFWYSGSNAEFLADCTVTTHAQPEADLGERMRLALTDGQRRSERPAHQAAGRRGTLVGKPSRSKRAASCSVMALPSCSASVMVTAR